MNSNLYKKLNATNTIEQSLPVIIEAFVSFYGEENRKHIEEKFNNTIMIGYGIPDNLNSIIIDIKENLIEEQLKKFFDSAGVVENRIKLKKILFEFMGDIDFDFKSLIPFQQYISYIESIDKENISDYDKKKVLNFLQQLNPSITLDNMDKLIENNSFDDVDKLIPLYREMMKSYNDERAKISYLEQQLNEQEKIKQALDKKYWLQLLSEFSYLFPISEIERVNFQVEKGLLLDSSIIKSYLGNFLDSTPLISAFSEQNEEILLNGKDWQKESIIDDRIKFFKGCGIDLGDDYNLYKNNEQCQKLIPSPTLIEKIKLRKKELFELKMNQYYQSTVEYKVNREKINKNNLLNKDDNYDANAYFNNRTFVSPNIVYENGKYSLLPIMCINVNFSNEHLDSSVIHELNHVLELNLIGANDKYYECICGWDILEDAYDQNKREIRSLDIDDSKRKYELFNEIVNEIIAQEITTILHTSNNYIFNTKDNAEIKGGTSYEHTLFLVKQFYDTYKKEILESRKTGNIQLLFDVVGKENLEKLNDLFYVFNDNFSGMKIYSVYESIHNNVETDETIIYKKLIQDRDKILENMYEYSEKNKKNNRK